MLGGIGNNEILVGIIFYFYFVITTLNWHIQVKYLDEVVYLYYYNETIDSD
jgi:hypothetical protein